MQNLVNLSTGISRTTSSRAQPIVLLEWDAPTFSVASVQVTGRQFEITQQFTIKNSEFDTQTPQEQALWVKRQLKNNGINQSNVHLVVPRKFVSTQLLELPSQLEQEISAFCALQLKARGDELSELAGDYLPLPQELARELAAASSSPSSLNQASLGQGSSNQATQASNAELATDHGGGPATAVFLASIAKAKLDAILEVSNEAGLQVEGLHIAEFSLGSAQADARGNGISLQVLRVDKRIEFIVAAQGIPLASQTFPFLDDGPEVASVMPALGTRVLQSLGTETAKQLSDIALFGEGVGVLREHFEAYFGVQIRVPAENETAKYPFLSLARAIAHADPLLDFANSRINSDSQSRSAYSWQPFAAVAMLLLTATLVFANWQQRTTLANLTTQLTSLQAANNSTETQKSRAAYQQLATWIDQSPNWPSTLAALSECFPDNEAAYVDSLRAEVDRNNVATINASGSASRVQDVLLLQDEIVDHPMFTLTPRRVASADDEQYGAKYSLQLRVEQVSAKERQ